MTGLTPRQAETLACIRRLTAGRVPPTYARIAAEIGTTKSGVHRLVHALAERGHLTLAGHRRARSIALVERAIRRQLVPPGEVARQLAVLLAELIDQPLARLPGPPEPGQKGETEIYVRHFRPDLSERAAGLLEEMGQ